MEIVPAIAGSFNITGNDHASGPAVEVISTPIKNDIA
jgi:hypothetical protein